MFGKIWENVALFCDRSCVLAQSPPSNVADGSNIIRALWSSCAPVFAVGFRRIQGAAGFVRVRNRRKRVLTMELIGTILVLAAVVATGLMQLRAGLKRSAGSSSAID